MQLTGPQACATYEHLQGGRQQLQQLPGGQQVRQQRRWQAEGPRRLGRRPALIRSRAVTLCALRRLRLRVQDV